MSIAIGPLGRNGEATGSINSNGKMAAMYSYSKTRGLFGGVSVEGSVIVERQDANSVAYRSNVTARQLLSGVIDPPEWAFTLIKTLESCTGMPGSRGWIHDENYDFQSSYAFGGGVSSPGNENRSSLRNWKKKTPNDPFPPPTWGQKKDSGSYFQTEFTDDFGSSTQSRSSWEGSREADTSSTPKFGTHFESDFTSEEPHARRRAHVGLSPPWDSTLSDDTFTSGSRFDSPSPSHSGQSSAHTRSISVASPFSANSVAPGDGRSSLASHQRSYSLAESPHTIPKSQPAAPSSRRDGVARAIALYDFQAVESGDLSFSKGDVITVMQKSESSDDWWTGKVNGQEGIFPANFVEVA